MDFIAPPQQRAQMMDRGLRVVWCRETADVEAGPSFELNRAIVRHGGARSCFLFYETDERLGTTYELWARPLRAGEDRRPGGLYNFAQRLGATRRVDRRHVWN